MKHDKARIGRNALINRLEALRGRLEPLVEATRTASAAGTVFGQDAFRALVRLERAELDILEAIALLRVRDESEEDNHAAFPSQGV